MRGSIWVPAACVLLAGCGGDEREMQTGSATLTGVTVTASASAEGGEAGGGESGSLLDVGGGQGSAEGGDNTSGCEKVDFLFVIDSSGSMGDQQDALIASFPGFISAIQATLDEAQDYHIMVVDTDSEWGGQCALLCPTFGFCPDVPDYPCETGAPSPCDATLGAGVNFPIGDDSSNRLCQFSTGGRYIDSSEASLGAAFACAAKVGTDGDGGERPMAALVGALSDQLSAPGACNEGFLRDDAILVVTVITDEEDDDSPGTPDGWYQNVIAAKDGDPNAIVTLGLINDTDVAAPVCPPEVQNAVKVRTFVEMFPRHIRGSVCEADYSSFFQQAVDLIDTTCDDFVPPG